MKKLEKLFDKYFHEVLLSDDIYLDLCDARGTLCMENVTDGHVCFALLEEMQFQQIELLTDIRHDYILSYCLTVFNKRN